MNTAYNLLGRNSNSVAYSRLAGCGETAIKPDSTTPGWGCLLPGATDPTCNATGRATDMQDQ